MVGGVYLWRPPIVTRVEVDHTGRFALLKFITQEGLPCVGTDPSSLGARTDVLKALAPGGKILSYWPSPYFKSN